MADPSFESKSRGVSRRRFGRRAALAAAAGILSSPALIAQRKATSASLPPADEDAVTAKYANVIRMYGDRLSPSQRRRARETLVQHQHMLMRVREFSLDNNDAPATGIPLGPQKTQSRSRVL